MLFLTLLFPQDALALVTSGEQEAQAAMAKVSDMRAQQASMKKQLSNAQKHQVIPLLTCTCKLILNSCFILVAGKCSAGVHEFGSQSEGSRTHCYILEE